MKKKHYDFDLIVIGSGAGGSAAATIVARTGKKVAIVESEVFGGTSPNFGDVPTKSLLHAAQLFHEARHGERFGLRSATIGFNYPSLLAWKDMAVKRTGAAGNKKYYENEGITSIEGAAHFLSPHEITVNRRNYSAASFLIATGSSWKVPDIKGLGTIDYATPETLFNSLRLPKSLFIVGGGETAVELAQFMGIFGTKVYIATSSSRLLPNYDNEVGESLHRFLSTQHGVTVLTNTETLAVERENIALRATYGHSGQEHSLRVDQLLIADTLEPNLDIGLENAGVEYTPNGISVNDYLQTSVKHIYAAGNVLGRHPYTHAALLESRIAAHNLMHKNKLLPDYNGMPRVVFTRPGIASTGLGEKECINQNLKIKTALAPINIVSRSNTSDFHEGFVKIITDKKGTVIGATVMAPNADEIIHELALAVRYAMSAAQLAALPHAFLSWSEAVRVAANKLV